MLDKESMFQRPGYGPTAKIGPFARCETNSAKVFPYTEQKPHAKGESEVR